MKSTRMGTVDDRAALVESELGEYLCKRGLLEAGPVDVEAAGDGNINWVRRARHRASGKSVILKQARPALERFPQYQASTERIVFENRYYELARPLDRDAVCPTVLHFDETRKVLVLEDLGAAPRLDASLLRGNEVDAALEALARLLGRVHAATTSRPELAARFANDDMRRLHGDHIFHLPFRSNDFPLEARLARRAEAVHRDLRLREIADRAYARYLEPRGALVHADVQAGNVLLTPRGPKLLDAEIAHVGDPAFDLGTLLAHLWMPALHRGELEEARTRAGRVWIAYVEAHACDSAPRVADAVRYAGIEIMRRTIGAARVPAVQDVETSLAAVDLAERLMRNPPEHPEDVELS